MNGRDALKPIKQTTESPAHVRLSRDTYWIVGATFAALALLVACLLALPRIAGAFWPFTPASGAVAEAPFSYGTKLALSAATNVDPSPYKGALDIETTNGTALIPNSGPDGTLVLPGSSQNGGRISLYVVREGDTLSEIAGMFGVTPNTIKWANDIRDVALIRPGLELLILPIDGVQITVKKGDTLATLAKKYSADAGEIALYNGLAEGDGLVVGTELVIPGGEIAAPKIAAPSASRTASGGGSIVPSDAGFINPVPGSRITQGLHGYNGIDFGAPSGTPIYAVAGGTVIVARAGGGWNGGYGNYIVIDHGGFQTLYAHLSSVAVSVGQSVGQGEYLGGIGRTGKATGNHLHFETRGRSNPFSR